MDCVALHYTPCDWLHKFTYLLMLSFKSVFSFILCLMLFFFVVGM